MEQVIAFLRDFNIFTVIIRLCLAVIFGGIIGLERGRQRRAAGLRTHVLVCVGATLTVLVGFFVRDVLGVLTSDPLRISAQVISGIGFLGVGTILLKGRFQITGLTTSAGLWVTAAIGLALGAGFYEGAITAFAVSLITVLVLHKIERRVNSNHTAFGIYIEIRTDSAVRECLRELSEKYSAHDVQVTLPRSGISGNVGIEASVHSSKAEKIELNAVKEYFESLEYVVFAIESL